MGEICTILWAISPLTNGRTIPVIINVLAHAHPVIYR